MLLCTFYSYTEPCLTCGSIHSTWACMAAMEMSQRRFTAGRRTTSAVSNSSNPLDFVPVGHPVSAPAWAVRPPVNGSLVAQRIRAFQGGALEQTREEGGTKGVESQPTDSQPTDSQLEDPEFLQALAMAKHAAQILESAEPSRNQEWSHPLNTAAAIPSRGSVHASALPAIGSDAQIGDATAIVETREKPHRAPKVLTGMPPPPPRSSVGSRLPRVANNHEVSLSTHTEPTDELRQRSASLPCTKGASGNEVCHGGPILSSIGREETFDLNNDSSAHASLPRSASLGARSRAHAAVCASDTTFEARRSSQDWLRAQLASIESDEWMADVDEFDSVISGDCGGDSAAGHNPHVSRDLVPTMAALRAHTSCTSLSRGPSFSKSLRANAGGLPPLPRLTRATSAAANTRCGQRPTPSLRRRFSVSQSWSRSTFGPDISISGAAKSTLPPPPPPRSRRLNQDEIAHSLLMPLPEALPPPPPPRRKRLHDRAQDTTMWL